MVAAELKCAANAAVGEEVAAGGEVDVGGGDDAIGVVAIVVLPDVVSEAGGDRPNTGDTGSDTEKNQNGK
jgi:hypothetical protein